MTELELQVRKQEAHREVFGEETPIDWAAVRRAEDAQAKINAHEEWLKEQERIRLENRPTHEKVLEEVLRAVYDFEVKSCDCIDCEDLTEDIQKIFKKHYGQT